MAQITPIDSWNNCYFLSRTNLRHYEPDNCIWVSNCSISKHQTVQNRIQPIQLLHKVTKYTRRGSLLASASWQLKLIGCIIHRGDYGYRLEAFNRLFWNLLCLFCVPALKAAQEVTLSQSVHIPLCKIILTTTRIVLFSMRRLKDALRIL